MESGLTLARLDRLARRIDVEYPWSDRSGLDELTMASWMHRHVHTRVARTMLELLIENVFACAPSRCFCASRSDLRAVRSRA